MYSLGEPLPADVVAHAAGPFGGYRRFPVFSRPWLLGRCTIFVPATVGMGALQGLLIGLEFGDTRLGWQSAAVCIPIWVVIASGGPALATFARHHLPPARLTVALGIALGIAISFLGQHLADIYSRVIIVPRYMAIFPGFDPTRWPHRIVPPCGYNALTPTR